MIVTAGWVYLKALVKGAFLVLSAVTAQGIPL